LYIFVVAFWLHIALCYGETEFQRWDRWWSYEGLTGKFIESVTFRKWQLETPIWKMDNWKKDIWKMKNIQHGLVQKGRLVFSRVQKASCKCEQFSIRTTW